MIKNEDILKMKKAQNIVKVYEVPTGSTHSIPVKCLYETTNVVTNEIAEIMAGRFTGNEDYKFTHIYGQWGEPGDFAENGGPFFTPGETNTVADLTDVNIFTTNAEAAIIQQHTTTQADQALYTNNVGNYLAPLTGNDGKSYIGAGLVTVLPDDTKLLAAHVALPGIIKKASADLLIWWAFIFTNN